MKLQVTEKEFYEEDTMTLEAFVHHFIESEEDSRKRAVMLENEEKYVLYFSRHPKEAELTAKVLYLRQEVKDLEEALREAEIRDISRDAYIWKLEERLGMHDDEEEEE